MLRNAPGNAFGNAPSIVPKNMPKNMRGNALRNTPRDARRDTSRDISSDTPKDTPSDVPSDVPSNTLSDALRGMSRDMRRGTPRSTLRDTPTCDVLSGVLEDVPSIQPASNDSDLDPHMRLVAEEEVSLLELLAASKPGITTGRPRKLTEADKDHLVVVVKRDWATRHMSLVEIQQEAGFGHIAASTVLNALHERGIKAYREEFKFILKSQNKAQRLVYCQERKDWHPDQEWTKYSLTDKM